MSETKIAKVTFEFENGAIQSVSGSDAQAFLNVINGPLLLEQIRSGKPNTAFAAIKWTTEREANPSPKPSPEEV